MGCRWGVMTRCDDSELGVINKTLDNIPDEFDIFWNKLRESNSDKFLAMRSATDIQWQFSKSIAVKKKPRIFIVWEDREIKGYAIVTRQDSK